MVVVQTLAANQARSHAHARAMHTRLIGRPIPRDWAPDGRKNPRELEWGSQRSTVGLGGRGHTGFGVVFAGSVIRLRNL